MGSKHTVIKMPLLLQPLNAAIFVLFVWIFNDSDHFKLVLSFSPESLTKCTKM